MDQCVEQQVRSFFVAQSSDPADPKSLFTHAEDAPRGPAVEWRCALLPRVLHDVDPIGGDMITNQLFPQRMRDGDHAVEAAIGAPVQAFVESAFPVASCQAMPRCDSRDA